MSNQEYEETIDRLKAVLLEASYRETALKGEIEQLKDELEQLKHYHSDLSIAYQDSEHRCDQCNKEAQQIMADLHYLQRMIYEGQF